MAKESKEEGRIVKEREHQFGGKPEKKAPSVKSELPEGMKAPRDPGDKNRQMGGDHKGDSHGMKADMGRATRHLERETERGGHVATVAGEKQHGHSGSMKGHR